jgi:phage baseplate assembly protein W
MQLGYPFCFDGRGRTTAVSEEEHIKQMIEQLLFTSPFERVNRPGFGSGISKLVFAANSDALAATANLTVQGSLQQWLGDLIQVEAVEVNNEDEVLRIAVKYTIRRTQTRQVAVFQQGAGK